MSTSAWIAAVQRMDRAVQSNLGKATVVYAPYGGNPAPVTIVGMFDRHHIYQAEGGLGVERVMPAVFLRLEDLPEDPTAPGANPRLSITDPRDNTTVDYTVQERHLDSMGGVMLFLRQAIP